MDGLLKYVDFVAQTRWARCENRSWKDEDGHHLEQEGHSPSSWLVLGLAVRLVV